MAGSLEKVSRRMRTGCARGGLLRARHESREALSPAARLLREKQTVALTAKEAVMYPLQCALRAGLAGLCAVLGVQVALSQSSPQTASAESQPIARPNQ